MLQPWSHVFATPGRRLGCFYLFTFVCPILGRPPIVDVRIPSRIVRIHRARSAIRVVRVVPKTESRFSKPVFQPCSWRIQRSLSRWRTCPLHMDFFISNYLQGMGRPAKRPTVITLEADLDVRLHRTALGCTLLHLPHRRTWADPPKETRAIVAGACAVIERGAQLEVGALNRKRRAALWCTVRSLPYPSLLRLT